MNLIYFVFCLFFMLANNAIADYANTIGNIVRQTLNPSRSLKSFHPLQKLGNEKYKDAQIVFLPEIHDDPDSLLMQLLVVAKESQNKNSDIVILDESLTSLKKSNWDALSQKSIEVVAALDFKKERKEYNPRVFENKLSFLTKHFQNDNEQLKYRPSKRLWSLNGYIKREVPFFGWDNLNEKSLAKRNHMMVNTLQKFADKNRILVFAGARHIPDLEYLSSLEVICQKERFPTKKSYFDYIEKKYGDSPSLPLNIGSTLPIYKYVKDKKYNILFSKSFFQRLKNIMAGYKGANCISI